MAREYNVGWKRTAFFRFVEQFPTNKMSQELKSKVLQLVLIPSFAVSFEKGQTTLLSGTAPAPYHDSADNVVSVFINKVWFCSLYTFVINLQHILAD